MRGTLDLLPRTYGADGLSFVLELLCLVILLPSIVWVLYRDVDELEGCLVAIVYDDFKGSLFTAIDNRRGQDLDVYILW